MGSLRLGRSSERGIFEDACVFGCTIFFGHCCVHGRKQNILPCEEGHASQIRWLGRVRLSNTEVSSLPGFDFLEQGGLSISRGMSFKKIS